ncbi:MAG: hypothetical protein ACUVUC_01660 [Thermoguttaceae bacterium]
MPYLVGADEAGYGPNLGPLVISATLWHIPQQVAAEDLDQRLRESIAKQPQSKGSGPEVQGSDRSSRPGRLGINTHTGHANRQAAFRNPSRLPIGDSKRVYQSGKGIGLLEQGVLGALAVLGQRPGTWRGVWQALAPDAAEQWVSTPWYADYDEPVPLACDLAGRERWAAALAGGLESAGLRLLAIRSRAIFEPCFNQLLDRHGSKGAALSHETLRLVARMIEPLRQGPICVLCDKHGGRNAYGDLLADAFPGSLIEVEGQGRKQSLYRFGPQHCRVEVRIQAKADSCLPAALASMVSKYLRELAMRALNAYWCARVPGLARTAGYPADARRFKAAIAGAQAGLAIPDRLLWRRK